MANKSDPPCSASRIIAVPYPSYPYPPERILSTPPYGSPNTASVGVCKSGDLWRDRAAAERPVPGNHGPYPPLFEPAPSPSPPRPYPTAALCMFRYHLQAPRTKRGQNGGVGRGAGPGDTRAARRPHDCPYRSLFHPAPSPSPPVPPPRPYPPPPKVPLTCLEYKSAASPSQPLRT